MHQNSKCQSGKLSTTLLIIGFHNYRDNYIKKMQYNKGTNFPNFTVSKSWQMHTHDFLTQNYQRLSNNNIDMFYIKIIISSH